MKILRSYRWRRRLVITAIAAGILVPGIWLAVASSHSAPSSKATGPEVAENRNIYQPPKSVPFRQADQRAVRRVLAKFILTAVARRHVADSWELVGPGLRQNVTEKQWATGTIPVSPYPVRNKDVGVWDLVEYSYKNAVGLETLLFPKVGSGARPLSVDVDVIRSHDGNWRVNYFMPTKFRGGPSLSKAARKALKRQEARRKARAVAHPRAAAPKPLAEAPHLKGAWWTIPLILLALAIVVPITVALVIWIRNRRATAAWGRSRS